MHLSVEGLRPWDWSYPVLQYLREWLTPTVIIFDMSTVVKPQQPRREINFSLVFNRGVYPPEKVEANPRMVHVGDHGMVHALCHHKQACRGAKKWSKPQ